MKKLLSNLEEAMASFKSPFIQIVNPGLDRNLIIDFFKGINLSPTEGLIRLYEWHNGVNLEKNYNIGFFGFNGIFIPLSKSLECYHNRVEDSWAIGGEIIGKYFFPISYDDDFLVFLKANSPYYGSVFIVSPGSLISEPQMIFDSIGSMLQSVLECYRLSYYSLEDSDEMLDFSASWNTFRKNNPKSEYWESKQYP